MRERWKMKEKLMAWLRLGLDGVKDERTAAGEGRV